MPNRTMMNENPWHPPFPPGTLWQRVIEADHRGKKSGALAPIPTSFVEIQDDGVPFVVRIVDNLRRKQQERRRQGAVSGSLENPFLPCDQDLYVADVSDTHVAVLNKYNVIERHLLIVTRGFEHQEKLLTAADFHALWRCLREVDGLAFYNGGTVAGASQEHKHLQLAPYPLTEGRRGLPIDPFVEESLEVGITRVDAFPFKHALTPCPDCWCENPQQAACESLTCYLALLAATGLATQPEGRLQPGPYNLLVTREWMLLIPRSRELFEGMSINALGYAGGLLVRDENELEKVRAAGPMNILSSTGMPWG